MHANKGTEDPNQYCQVMSKLKDNPVLDSSLLNGLFAPFLLVWLGFGIIFGDVSDYAQFLFLRAGHGVMMLHEKNHMYMTLFSQGDGRWGTPIKLPFWGVPGMI